MSACRRCFGVDPRPADLPHACVPGTWCLPFRHDSRRGRRGGQKRRPWLASGALESRPDALPCDLSPGSRQHCGQALLLSCGKDGLRGDDPRSACVPSESSSVVRVRCVILRSIRGRSASELRAGLSVTRQRFKQQRRSHEIHAAYLIAPTLTRGGAFFCVRAPMVFKNHHDENECLTIEEPTGVYGSERAHTRALHGYREA
jgi:hypothetical protein